MEAGHGAQRAQQTPAALAQGTGERERAGSPVPFDVMPNEQQSSHPRPPSLHGRQQGPPLTSVVIVVRSLLCVGLPLLTVALLEYATVLFPYSPGGDFQIPTLRVPESFPEALPPLGLEALSGRGVEGLDARNLPPPPWERREALSGRRVEGPDVGSLHPPAGERMGGLLDRAEEGPNVGSLPPPPARERMQAQFGSGMQGPDVGSSAPSARQRMEALKGVKGKRTPKSCWSREEMPLFVKASHLCQEGTKLTTVRTGRAYRV